MGSKIHIVELENSPGKMLRVNKCQHVRPGEGKNSKSEAPATPPLPGGSRSSLKYLWRGASLPYPTSIPRQGFHCLDFQHVWSSLIIQQPVDAFEPVSLRVGYGLCLENIWDGLADWCGTEMSHTSSIRRWHIRLLHIILLVIINIHPWNILDLCFK